MFNINKYNEIKDLIKKRGKKTQIVAISKFQTQKDVILALNSGLRIFGENRVIEAEGKFKDLKKKYKDIDLHLTGPLQTNKVKKALQIFDCFQTLDREKLANEFKKNAAELSEKKFFIQINTGKEKNKSGIFEEQAGDFIFYCSKTLDLNVVGLMCIPPIDENPREHFNILKNIATKNKLQDLSMGMSSDYTIGIDVGATFIRLGTVLFGGRKNL